LAIPLYVVLAVVKPSFGIIFLTVMVEQLVSGIGNAAHVVFLIQRSRGVFSASHYAFATAIVSLGSTLSGYVSGPLNQHFGHPIFFTLAFVASWPALVLVWFVPKDAPPVEGADGPGVGAHP
jgi:PAT family beta-lactamase induction signal transducer AmpG